MSLLSEKERAKLARTKEILANGGNPFSHISAIEVTNSKGIGKLSDHCREVITSVPASSPTSSYSSTAKIVESRLIDSYVPQSITCMRCKIAIDYLVSTLCKVLINFIPLKRSYTTPVVESDFTISDVVSEEHKVLIPAFQEGRLCKDCLDYLYHAKYMDKDGNVQRVCTILYEKQDREFESTCEHDRTSSSIGKLRGYPSKGRKIGQVCKSTPLLI